jgi:hypothetical protein
MAFRPNINLQQRLLLFLYGRAGTGKTTAYLSLLKNKKLKLVVFALESTIDAALMNCFYLYNIEDIAEGQLIYVKPEIAKLGTEATIMEVRDGSFLTNIVKNMTKATGIDVKTGKPVILQGLDSNFFDENTVVVLDGYSSFIRACLAKAQQIVIDKKEEGNEWSVFKRGKPLSESITAKFIENTRGHVIVCGHENLADDKALEKYKFLKRINPLTFTRSSVDAVCGMFTYVMYAKRDSLSNRFVLSVSEPLAYTRDGINRTKFKDFTDAYNAGKKPTEKIDLSNLPPDLTHECYGFFNNQDGE